MPKYWSVKTLLVTATPSGTGVVESLAPDHAPLTMMVSFGTAVLGSGLVALEKSPPFLGETGWAGALDPVVGWIAWPQARSGTNKIATIRKPEHLDCILLSSVDKAAGFQLLWKAKIITLFACIQLLVLLDFELVIQSKARDLVFPLLPSAKYQVLSTALLPKNSGETRCVPRQEESHINRITASAGN